MSLLLRGGVVVSPHSTERSEILCEGESIMALLTPGERPSADQVLDVSGLLIFPGFIDPHVHSRDPGMTHKEDFEHSTRAAAAGGVTTVLEMPNAIPPVADVATFVARAEQHERVASVDFGLWGLSLGLANLEELEGLFEQGAVAVKLFWGYALHRVTKQLIYNVSDEPPENVLPPPETGDVLEVFREVARLDGLFAAHCEDRRILDAAVSRLGHPIESYDDLLAARPVVAEAASVAVGIEFSRATGCRFHVVHLSSQRAMELIRRARGDGIPVTAETCPQYLTLTNESYERVGPVMKVYPPVRLAADQQALWSGILDGSIVSIGSDHAPHTIEEKQQGFSTQPAGTVGVETLVPLMLNEMSAGRLSPERLAWVLSEGTARLFGLYPRKGAVIPGNDADLTVVDPDAVQEIDNAKLHSKQPFSPWHGVRVRGAPKASILRGNVIMQDGEPIGQPMGRLVRATHPRVHP